MDTRLADIGKNFNEMLVEPVGRHKILYDTKAEGYSNFQLQDEIWRKIANKLDEDDIRQTGETSSPSSDETPFLLHDEDSDTVSKLEATEEPEISKKFEPDEEIYVNKRQMWEPNSDCDCQNSKKCKVSEHNDEAELNFFKSLLPEMKKMTGKQENQLKITILNAIDSILYSNS